MSQRQNEGPKEYRHKWDRSGERCVKCGDKDWMGGPCSKADEESPQPASDEELKNKITIDPARVSFDGKGFRAEGVTPEKIAKARSMVHADIANRESPPQVIEARSSATENLKKIYHRALVRIQEYVNDTMSCEEPSRYACDHCGIQAILDETEVEAMQDAACLTGLADRESGGLAKILDRAHAETQRLDDEILDRKKLQERIAELKRELAEAKAEQSSAEESRQANANLRIQAEMERDRYREELRTLTDEMAAYKTKG